MKRTPATDSLMILLITSLTVLGATEEHLNHRFAVQPGGAVVVDIEFGNVSISTNNSSEVVVDVYRKIGRKKKADEEAFFREHPVLFTQDGNTATIRSRTKTRNSFSSSGRIQNEARYTITVPARSNARLDTGGGNMTVTGLTGEVRAKTGGGGMEFAGITGPVDGETGGGSVSARACAGKLTLRSGGGGMDIANSSGSLDANCGGGSISVRAFQGPAKIHTGGGGLTVDQVTGTVDGSTGGGSISTVLPSEITDPVTLSTGGGGITLSAIAGAAFTVDARTGGGSVSTDLPVTVIGKLEHGRLQGPVNGGGKTVQLRSGGGSIYLKKL